ncbi:MAG: hypothetical protein AB1646_17635 [Thermodesulfobacteriota bacterium]
MMVRVLLYVTAGLCFLCGPVLLQWSYAQEFRYQVPRAPEFDARGNVVGPSPAAEHASRNASHARAARAHAGDPSGPPGIPARARRASAPAGTAVNAPRGPIMATPSGGPAPMAAANPQPGARPQGTPDCSRFPMMLANYRSDAEMKAIAVQFRDCLIMNGWDQQRAVAHVITTLETIKMGRQ